MEGHVVIRFNNNLSERLATMTVVAVVAVQQHQRRKPFVKGLFAAVHGAKNPIREVVWIYSVLRTGIGVRPSWYKCPCIVCKRLLLSALCWSGAEQFSIRLSSGNILLSRYQLPNPASAALPPTAVFEATFYGYIKTSLMREKDAVWGNIAASCRLVPIYGRPSVNMG